MDNFQFLNTQNSNIHICYSLEPTSGGLYTYEYEVIYVLNTNIWMIIMLKIIESMEANRCYISSNYDWPTRYFNGSASIRIQRNNIAVLCLLSIMINARYL